MVDDVSLDGNDGLIWRNKEQAGKPSRQIELQELRVRD